MEIWTQEAAWLLYDRFGNRFTYANGVIFLVLPFLVIDNEPPPFSSDFLLPLHLSNIPTLHL